MNIISNQYNELLIKRKEIEKIDYEHNEIIQAMLELFTKDIKETIYFLENECSEEQFVWIGELIGPLYALTKSDELLEAFGQLLNKYPQTTSIFGMTCFLNTAKDY